MPASPASAPHGAVVKKTLLVNCSPAQAFRVFTQNMGLWWPADHHTGALPFRDVCIEPRAGGRWYEIDADERVGQWGSVLAWEPPGHLVLGWHLGTDFTFEADAARASQLDIRFHAFGANQTRVAFEHRHIERHGEGYEKLRDSLDHGWPEILDAYAGFAAGPAAGK